MNDSCKGISSFVRKFIVRACLIGFEKGSQSKAVPLRWVSPRSAKIFLAICLSSYFIERWTSLSISIRQAKAFLQLVERRCLKPTSPVILGLLQ